MQSKILSRQILLIVVLIGFALFLEFLVNFISKISTYSSLTSLTADTTLLYEQEKVNSSLSTSQAGLPVRLKIPRINIDASVEYVGLTSDGTMDIPKDPADVAWFNLGQRPGENGSAVISGHYGWKNGKAAVFDYLYKLRKGDKLYIEDDKGMTTTFAVREIRRYDPKADASDVFSSSDGRAHLNLVTCEGVWDRVSKTYSKRLVVFTDKVDF